MNKLDHIVKNSINNKDQRNYAIEYESKFDSKFTLFRWTENPLPVLTVSL